MLAYTLCGRRVWRSTSMAGQDRFLERFSSLNHGGKHIAESINRRSNQAEDFIIAMYEYCV